MVTVTFRFIYNGRAGRITFGPFVAVVVKGKDMWASGHLLARRERSGSWSLVKTLTVKSEDPRWETALEFPPLYPDAPVIFDTAQHVPPAHRMTSRDVEIMTFAGQEVYDALASAVAALDDASGVVDVGRDDEGVPTEAYPYEAVLEQARVVLDRHRPRLV